MTPDDLQTIRKTSGAIVQDLPEKIYLKKDIKLILLELIQELEKGVTP